jgi:phytoene synthase
MTTLADGRTETTAIASECEAILAHHAKSFRWASWFLPRQMRLDASIVYAFCRLVDDAVDDAKSPADGRRKLLSISEHLRGDGSKDDLITAYREVADRRGFGLGPAWGLIAGAESDLGIVKVRDDAELLTYCYRVAGTVGLMMCGILGVTSAAARAHAVQLGVAMQLTNICRDVREDADLGRIYLPESRLRQEDPTNAALGPGSLLDLSGRRRRAVAGVVLGLIADSERVYALASQGFRYIPARPRLAIIIAARLYRAIGRRLRRRGGDALAGRVVVPNWHKALLLFAALGSWTMHVLLPQRQRLLLGSPADRSKPLPAPFGGSDLPHVDAPSWTCSLPASAAETRQS